MHKTSRKDTVEAPNINSQINSVGIVNHPIFALHLTGKEHFESPKRVDAIVHRLIHEKMLTLENSIAPRLASKDELKLAHTIEYICLVEREAEGCQEGEVKTLTTGDVAVSNQSFEVARYAVGGILNAIDAVMSGRFSSVFCVIRPPGHHAFGNIGMGFCLFNNVAIGAFYALTRYSIKRVLIVDWDLHHGNGTEELVRNDPRIFYFSTHQSPLWPGTGQENEKGCGNIQNIEIKGGETSRAAIFDAYAKNLTMAMESFKPEFVFISAGFDAHKSDPLGQLELQSNDFKELTLQIRKIADRFAKGRIVSALEGGYNLDGLAESAFEHVKGLAQKI